MNTNSNQEDVPDAPQKPKSWPFSHSSRSFFPQIPIIPGTDDSGWYMLEKDHYRFVYFSVIFHPPGRC
jgi:hypothetical protein